VGRKAAVSDSAERWCAAGNLGASKVSIRMDDRTDVNPVPNAQVCVCI